MTAQLLLIRHAAVADHYHGRCYGRSDVELSLDGQRRSLELSRELSSLPIARVMHSGLQRTRFLADELAKALGQHAETCDLLQERDYGSWELQSWDALYEQFGDEMSRVVSEPQTYRPGGGETTFDLRDRVLRWFNSLSCEGITVAVTHGGPIAALRGACQGLPVADWLNLIPAYGEVTSLAFPSSHGTKVIHSFPSPLNPSRDQAWMLNHIDAMDLGERDMVSGRIERGSAPHPTPLRI